MTSLAVEREIEPVTAQIADPELLSLFTDCYPNTLDATVNFHRRQTTRISACPSRNPTSRMEQFRAPPARPSAEH